MSRLCPHPVSSPAPLDAAPPRAAPPHLTDFGNAFCGVVPPRRREHAALVAHHAVVVDVLPVDVPRGGCQHRGGGLAASSRVALREAVGLEL